MEGGAKIMKKSGFRRHRFKTAANPPQLGFRPPCRNLPPPPSLSPSSPSSPTFLPDTAPSIICDVALVVSSSSSLLSPLPSCPDTSAPFIHNDAVASSLPSSSPPPSHPIAAAPLIICDDALASSSLLSPSPSSSPLCSRLNMAAPLIICSDALASSSSSSSSLLLLSHLDTVSTPSIICADALEEGGLPPIPHLLRSHNDRKGKAAVVSLHPSRSQKQGESGNHGDSEKHGEFVAQSSSSSSAAASSSGTLQWAVKGIRRDSRNMSETMPVSKESNGWRSTCTNRVIDLESPHNTYEPRHSSHGRAQCEAVHQEGKAYESNGAEAAHRNGGLSDGHIPMPSSDRSLSVRMASKPLPPKRRRIPMELEGYSIDLSEVEGAPIPRAGRRKRCRRSTQQQSTPSGFQQLIEIDDLESPRSVGAQETERERELEKERQIAEDERLARLLQQEYQSEVGGGDLMRNLRPLQHLGTRTDMNSVPIRAFLTGPGSSSSAQRLRSARFQRATGVGRVRRRGFVTSGGRSLHLPRQMNVDARMELLATLETLETALHLIHDDRDFNANDYEMLLALDENNDRHTGASRERIQMLPVSTVKDTDVVEEACSICLDEPETGDKIRRLPCMHGFHQQCIDQWLERQSKCPVCKASI